MPNFKIFPTGIFLLFLINVAFGQCPTNIGFDFGNFTNWEGATGSVNSSGTVSMSSLGIVNGRHTLFYAKNKQIDPYGKFLIASPNGSSTCVRLGDANTGAQAEQLSYTFNVPANDPDYSLIYYYAVVFQNPGHQPYQQPRFTANVFDVTDNKYISCGAFNFEASANLPGFKQSPVSAAVLYKDWSAVTINLLGYSGKTLRLEFTTNDCTQGGHFGYAYLDVNQNCTSPVSGNVYCSSGDAQINLVAPAGFDQYYWYKGTDFSTVIGNSNILTITPAPPIGASYAVRIVPFPGIGCEDTIYTTVRATEQLVLKLKDTLMQCGSPSVDITDSTITAGSNANFTYTYYTDAALTDNVIGPQAITTSGTYYVKATTPGGCSVVKPMHIFVGQSFLNVTNPAPVCEPATINLTDSLITAGSSPATLSYWRDANATIPLSNPTAVDSSGVYYIMAQTTFGCSAIKPVTVTVNKLPKLVINTLAPACNFIDITSPNITAGSSAGLTYSYWADITKTQQLPNPKNVVTSGTYYIDAVNSSGCEVIEPVTVGVYAPPAPIAVTKPAPVVYPVVVDLKSTFTPQSGIIYTYWRDSLLTKPLPGSAIDRSGNYYIKASNIYGCYNVYKVPVTVKPPLPVDFSTNLFTPNGDGVNDSFKFTIPFYITIKSFKIYNSYGKLLFETTDPDKFWDGKSSGKLVPVGTYYWLFNGHDNYSNVDIRQSGSVTVAR